MQELIEGSPEHIDMLIKNRARMIRGYYIRGILLSTVLLVAVGWIGFSIGKSYSSKLTDPVTTYFPYVECVINTRIKAVDIYFEFKNEVLNPEALTYTWNGLAYCENLLPKGFLKPSQRVPPIGSQSSLWIR